MSAHLTPRLWDSEFFGFPVGQIEGRELDEGALTALLLEAKHRAFELVYWQSDAQREVSASVLDRFAGQLLDRRLTYRLSLGDVLNDSRPPARDTIAEHAVGPATAELVELAIAAGEFSRFRLDRHLPGGLFEALYQTWIERSTRHEIADAVLIARSEDRRIAGVATISAHIPSATIGLISVRAGSRGRGVGRALMAAAHRWMAERGICESSVTTQECNRPACALYERCGYRVVDRSLVYHFWPTK